MNGTQKGTMARIRFAGVLLLTIFSVLALGGCKGGGGVRLEEMAGRTGQEGSP